MLFFLTVHISAMLKSIKLNIFSQKELKYVCYELDYMNCELLPWLSTQPNELPAKGVITQLC